MTSEERKEYMREYRKQHKDQIKRTAQKRNEKIALLALDHAEMDGNVVKCYMKSGTVFTFLRPFSE